MDNGRWTRLDNGGRPKLVDWLKLILPLWLVVSACCTNIQAQVQPNRFPKEVAPDSSNFETYSQKNGVNKRANLYDLKKYFTPRYIGQVAYVPGATGNALNRMEFIRAADGYVYYIDKDGKSVKFNSDGATIEQLSDSIAYVLNKVSRWDTSSTNELQTIYIVNHRLYISGVSQLGLSLSPYRDSIFIRSGVRDTLKTSTGYKVVLPLADGSETKVRVFDLLGLTGSGTTAAPYDIRVPGGTLSGSGGNGFVGFPVQSSVPGAPGSGFRMFSDASNRLSWIGSNGYVRTFEATGISANRVFKFQNKSYTLADSTDLASLQSTVSGLGSTYFPLPGGTLSGSGGNGFVGFPLQSSAPSAPGSGFRMFSDASNRLSWIGSNGFVRTFEATGITANRVFKFQNKSYTLADSTDVASLQSTVSGLGSTYFPLPGGTLSGSGGNGFVGFPVQSSAPITPSSGFRIFSDASNRLSWIGSNGYVRTFEATGISANRVFKFQNKSYTLADSTDLASLQSTVSGLGSTYFPLPGGTLNGSGGNGFVGFPAQSSAPATPSSGFRIYADNLGKLSWIGTNGYSRTFDGTANTASRMYTLPNNNGTIVLLEPANTWPSVQVFSSGSVFGSGSLASSELVKMTSTTQGFLPPVMTTLQRNSIASPSTMLMVGVSSVFRYSYYNGSAWVEIPSMVSGGLGSGQIAYGDGNGNLQSSSSLIYGNSTGLSSTSSNEYVLNLTNSTTTNSFKIALGNGSAAATGFISFFRNNSPFLTVNSSGNTILFSNITNVKGGTSSSSFVITGGYGGSNVGNALILGSGAIDAGLYTATSGTANIVSVNSSNDRLGASSGTMELNMFTVGGSIATSGTYSGIFRGIRVNPNIVTNVGVDHRSLEIITGNTLLGTFSGVLSVGATTTLSSTAIAQFVSSTQAFLPPKLTTSQRDAVGSGITGLTSITGGSGYTANFSAIFSGGGGTGAVATVTVSSGAVTGITVTNPGSGYTSAPSISFANGSGTGASATVTIGSVGLTGGLQIFNTTTQKTNVYSQSLSGWIEEAQVIKTGSVNLDFPLMSSDSNASFSVTCTGAAVGDAVAFTYDVSNDAGVTYNARVSAANTILFTAINASSSSVNPAPMNVSFTVIK